jgi:DNA polymerase II small subunit
VPLEEPARIARELASHGYAADREAITLLASAEDTAGALALAVEATSEGTLKLTAEDVRDVLTSRPRGSRDPIAESDAKRSETPPDGTQTKTGTETKAGEDPSVSTGIESDVSKSNIGEVPVETKGGSEGATARGDESAITTERSEAIADQTATASEGATRTADPSLRSLDIGNDMTGYSTGTGEYEDFVSTFRDRYERLAGTLRGRVNHRNAAAIQASPGGGDAGMIGMISDIRSTASGHWLVELEDTTGVFPCLVMKDKEIAERVDELLYDEIIAVEGSLSDDGGILFVDELYFPNIPRTHDPSTADRHVQAALISDIHVGSQEFIADAWHEFTSWLHTPEAARIEYLLIAGDMVEGVGVYPDQDEELDIVDIFDQYRAFSEYLKEVPGDIEIVMIPGNHDAVRLAEPQPGFDEELRAIMTAHDAQIVSNPAVVTIEGVSVLMYHGVSLDEVIAELPEEKANYDEPHRAMYQLLKKRHVAPQFGNHTRLAPEEKDYLVMDEVPDVFHTGHVHKLGWGKYRNVLAVNSGCWQAQTEFQKSVNIDPDAGFAPILDLDTLEMTVRKFS